MDWKPRLCLFFFIFLIKSSDGGLSVVNLAPSVGHSSNPKLNVGPALRYLTKGVFTKALLKGSAKTKEMTDSSLKTVSLEDFSDCAKKLICELQSRQDLTWDEQLIKETIPAKIEYTSPTIQLELAADLGQKKGKEQCAIVYSRCAMEYDDLVALLRQSGTSIEIPTNDQYDCTVLFLWNRKKIDLNATLTSTSTTTPSTTASAPTKSTTTSSPTTIAPKTTTKADG